MSQVSVPRGAVTAADGLVLVDKPAGLSSHDVVSRTRRMAATRKVGHAGTLDPMATGLLLLGVGRATRFLTYLVGADKVYEATVRLGQETVTEDAEGEITRAAGTAHLPTGPEAVRTALEQAMSGLRGQIMQVPSSVSAIKVDGVRSYARVRAGQDVTLPARPVTVYALSLRGDPRPGRAQDGTTVTDLDLEVACSSGTYVRALARDLGTALGTGAHLRALRRTGVGPFAVTEARSLEALAAQVRSGAQEQPPRGLKTLSTAEVARRCLPALELDTSEARALGYGQALPGEVLDRAQGGGLTLSHTEVVAGFAPDGTLVALLDRTDGRARPVLVLAPAGSGTRSS